MIRYFNKYKKSDPIQTPRFDYTVVTEIRYKDKHFRLASVFESQEDPLFERKKAMSVYGETRKIIEFLTRNGFWGEDIMEFTTEIFSRIANDEIQILGAGLDEDLNNLKLEYDTLQLFGFIPPMEPTMTINTPDGQEVTLLMTDIVY